MGLFVCWYLGTIYKYTGTIYKYTGTIYIYINIQEHTGTIYKMCGLYINHQDLLCPKNVLTLMQAVQN